jgi:hypothetical protein
MPIRLTVGYGERLATDHFDPASPERNDIIAVCQFWKKLQDTTATNASLQRKQFLGVVQECRAAADRLLSNGTLTACAFLRPHERFELGFLIAVALCCMTALESTLSKLPTKSSAQKKLDDNEAKAAQLSLREKLENLSTAEIVFLIGSDPDDYVKPFIRESGLVIATIINSKNLQFENDFEFIPNFEEAAAHHLRAWLSSGTSTATWIADYLNFEHQKAWSAKVSSDVKSIQQALTHWLQPTSEAAKKRAEAWNKYKESLIELPDLKETMFAEQFGVRHVFVQPVARYKVSGMNLEQGAKIPDVANLIAGLISERVPGDELILLCGGPGSGKSTLCRVIASELATNSNMHPVFLRLRRLQDGQDIPTFVEAHLQKEGIIDKFSDLGDVSNLVLILDGFDELVMASRSRLREFFNTLREDLASGPLRKAKAIVSGRDTLFPNGTGLPTGSHVISLLPFDKPRIMAWAEKWRSQHPPSGGKKFQPEVFFDEEAAESSSKPPPLHHLVSWPLTLHLVARVHNSGALDLTKAARQKIEKAALYKNIVFETALRQQEQSAGKGRLSPDQMREFVQAISWEMYSTSRDALDYNEGLPLLKAIYQSASEVELAELADVAIVNQPELTKGEEGGFEFVHKSFSEYFVAEKFAYTLEKICFKTPDYDSEHLTWRMSAKEAISESASLTAIRVITSEVQEMLEPMLADFKAFQRTAPTTKERTLDLAENLARKKSRVEQLIAEYASGSYQTDVVERVRGSRIVRNEREIHANFSVGLLILGCALSKRLSGAHKGNNNEVCLDSGHLWKLISVIQAGDIQIDGILAERILDPLRIGKDEDPIDVLYSPIPTRYLHGVSGARFRVEFVVSLALNVIAALLIENTLAPLLTGRIEHNYRDVRYFRRGRRSEILSELMERFHYVGILPDSSHWIASSPIRYLEDSIQELLDRDIRSLDKRDQRVLAEEIDRVQHYLQELMYRMDLNSYAFRDILGQTEHLLRSFVDALEKK